MATRKIPLHFNVIAGCRTLALFQGAGIDFSFPGRVAPGSAFCLPAVASAEVGYPGLALLPASLPDY